MKIIVGIILSAVILTSCATVQESDDFTRPKITPEDEKRYTTTKVISAFIGTVIGGFLGYLAVQGDGDGGKTALSSTAGAAAGTAAGWFLGRTITVEMEKHRTIDDSKLEENMMEYRMLEGR
ncbi:MAG: hypothetical protein ACLFP1_04705 [Candidatus Goldiibacteriota bacterium]